MQKRPGRQSWVAYHSRRRVVTLAGLTEVWLVVRRCETATCPRFHQAYRPEVEGALALPQAEVGLDVSAATLPGGLPPEALVPADLVAWRAFRATLEARHESRRAHLRFRRIPTRISPHRSRSSPTPHGRLIPRAACVVCHGGFGITQKALAGAVPVVVCPFGRDQFEIARRVEVAQAGVRLPRSELSPDRLRHAVQQALRCGPGAVRIADAFRGAGGAPAAATAIEALTSGAPHRAPPAAAGVGVRT
jgi:hypothetical protein